MNEPIGVIGIACPDEYPLLGFVSLRRARRSPWATRSCVVPSERYPLSATDFYQVLDTSDVPAGVVNIVTGARDALAKVLAEHDDVDARLVLRRRRGQRRWSSWPRLSNMKRTWVNYGHPRDWLDPVQGAGEEFLREATQVKNIWVPYGE